jgi:hypothetical protein
VITNGGKQRRQNDFVAGSFVDLWKSGVIHSAKRKPYGMGSRVPLKESWWGLGAKAWKLFCILQNLREEIDKIRPILKLLVPYLHYWFIV